MERILDNPEVDTQVFKYAGFWIRVGAYIIDAVILTVIQLLVIIISGGFDALLTGTTNTIPSLISILISFLYFAGMESSSKQATLGKMALGLKVTDLHGQQISFAKATGRYFAKILSAIILLIGYIMVAFDSKKQGLHDKLANTYVLEV